MDLRFIHTLKVIKYFLASFWTILLLRLLLLVLCHIYKILIVLFYSRCSEDTGKRRSQRIKDFKDVEKALHIPFQDRIITCRPNWKLVLVIIVLGTLVTIFHPPAVYNTDHLSNSLSRYVCFSFSMLSHVASLYFSFGSFLLSYREIIIVQQIVLF